MFRVKAQDRGWRPFRFALSLCLSTLVGGVLRCDAQQNRPAKPAPSPTPAPSAAIPTPPEEESRALDEAFDSASGNPQKLIHDLEKFLARYPESPRREQVLRTIYKQALQANDPRTATVYAEKLLERSPEDPDLLATLVNLLDRESDAASRAKAVYYSTRFIERAEKAADEPHPSKMPEEEWREMQALVRATGYLMRGKVYAKSGEGEKARADYEKSFAAYPTAQVAERLGDLAAKKGETERAIDYYATALAFPEKAADPTRRDQVRRKLGSLYVAKYHSEKGLGDLILSRYDQLIQALKARFESQDRPNVDARDPFDYVLGRLNGSELRLADLRGKVVVMDFWATWCAPCRLEGELVERARKGLLNEPDAAFLAVNVDEDRDGVANFVQEERWTIPVVYAQGLDHFLGVHALPTLVIFDRGGCVVFRQEGLEPLHFADTVERKVREALKRPLLPSTPSP